ncbi:MAG: AAA family ATPase, partial [Clostridiales bacterium]
MLLLYTLLLPPIDNIIQNEEKDLKIIISGAWNLLGKELEGQTRYKKVQGMLKTRYKKVQVILETRYKKVQNILETRYKKVQVFILRSIKMFKRKILDEINKWKNSLNIKKRALVIKGLRQIGKTTVVLNYCKKNYENLVYINFMENKSIKKIFDNDLVVNDLIRDISAAIPTARFIPQKTVIFFDEIQECASART